MNVYAVVSEPILYQEIIDPEIGGPWEEYCIAEIVAAPSRARARWIAWQSDSIQLGDIRNMPRFSVRLVRRNEDWPEGIVVGLDYLWAWGVPRPWLMSEAMLVENFLAVCGAMEVEQ